MYATGQDRTGQGMVVGSEAVMALLALLVAFVALRARGSSESAASAESWRLSPRVIETLGAVALTGSDMMPQNPTRVDKV